ncbi:phage head-tail adapter protein [Desulfosporosinus sp.]|uniref:phage head-tail adapter protein n=1 Tax=Desulfosporosinus sp. TaxID=157907 RepID=UPI0025C16EC4|nr:phage head-tail adapter protein [Desulfosporosinus sp.]MBC2722029.1 phage head-tail adapter protein [Desulfosporosinus sp.]MBC2728012.1 phage head-tail adapter protein [Desulfosporosinus sp.]
MDQVLVLIGVTIDHRNTDEIGNPIETITERSILAEELSVGSGEFYNAAVAGLRPEKRFEMYTREYQGEVKLKHEGITYRIIRTEGRSEKIRLSCERVAADG